MRKLSLKELNRIDVPAFKAQTKTPLILVLDNIRSALNVGSAFRTADAFALEAIYLCGITAQPPHREILKTAIGATDSVEWQYFKTTKAAVEQLKEKDIKVWAIEQTDQSTLLQDQSFEQANTHAFIFGNEVMGVSDDVLPLVDGSIEIPQFGTKHSLNISVCLGILAWEFTKTFRLA